MRKFSDILFCLMLIMTVYCSQKSSHEIVAQWQDIIIALSDFERSYFNYWQLTSEADSPNLRRDHARRMIEQELIANHSVSGGLITKETILPLLQKDLEYFMRRRYLEIVVKDTIQPPTEQETEIALKRINKRMRVRQLYARTRAEILELENRLQQGEPFADLAKKTMPDPLIAEKGGDLGWLGWGDTDLPVENVLYQLQPGEISKPVQSLMGWHIFRIDSVSLTIDFETSTQPLLRKDIRQKLVNRKLDIAAAHHLREIIWSKPLAINTKLFKEIWDYLAPLLPQNPKQAALQGYQNMEVNLKKEFSEQVLATVNGEPFRIAEFIAAVPSLPRNLLRPNLKKAIEIAIRDKLLVQEAFKLKLEQDPVVKEKIHRSQINYLYYAALSAADTSLFTKINLWDYYAENQDRYIDQIESEIEGILVEDRELALQIAKKVQEGTAFAELAQLFSKDEETRTKGGYLGFISNKENPLGEKAASLKKGDIFAPLKTGQGFYVIRIKNQRKTYFEFENIKTKIASDAQRDRYALLHRNLLPLDYRPEEIIFDELMLGKALSDQTKTIF